jgi:hypothetical protein
MSSVIIYKVELQWRRVSMSVLCDDSFILFVGCNPHHGTGFVPLFGLFRWDELIDIRQCYSQRDGCPMGIQKTLNIA